MTLRGFANECFSKTSQFSAGIEMNKSRLTGKMSGTPRALVQQMNLASEGDLMPVAEGQS